MRFKSVVDADGRPMVITKNQEMLQRHVDAGGTLIDSYPPRDTIRKWKFDGSDWVIDVAKEQEIDDAKQARKQAVIDAKAAYQENKALLQSGPNWTQGSTHMTLHSNILKMIKGIASLIDD